MNKRAVLSFLVFSFFAVSGMFPGAKALAGEQNNVKKEVKQANGSSVAPREKDEYMKHIEQEYEKLSQKVVELKDRADEKAREGMAKLDHSRDVAGRKLEELKKASGEKWEHAKKGVDSAMQDLRTAYDDARSHL